jgi:glycerophosphoryl diester phosphodiesterase
VKITKLGRPLPLISGGSLFDGDSTPGSPFTPGPPGHVPTSNGSNSYAWSSNVALITANGSNLVQGPFVNFQSGTGTTFSVSSNTLTISAGAGGGTAADISFDSDPTHLPLDPDNVQDAIVAAYGPRIFDVPGQKQFIVMAHHGDMNPTDGYPEDTLEAYRQAAERGADWVDLDLRKSSDGVWHCLHDSTLDRTTNMSGTIASKTAATIAAGAIDGGYGYVFARHGTSLKVPTLDDVIDALRPYNITFQFENKLATDATAEELAEYIVENRLVGRAFITCDDSEAAAIAAINPNITPQTDAADWNDLDTAADVRAYAPKAVFGVVPVTEFGTTDEGAVVDHLYSIGARGITANDIGAAVAAARAILAGGEDAVEEAGHWEIVMEDGVTAPPVPVTNEAEDDWLYAWVSD